MNGEGSWRWRFMGFESGADGRVVQLWFNGLPEEAKEEITDLCQGLQVVIRSRWRRPEFDPLVGAGGISELRPADIRCEAGCLAYRLYGFFGPNEHEYTILHGTLKPVRNDYHGKRTARERLAQIQRGQATAHEFDFEAEPLPEAAEGAGGED